MARLGKVYLVGSGTGSAAHLTLRAAALLQRAEVLVYDALAEGELLDWVSDRCLKLDVGKRGGQPSTPQAQINRLLVEHCQQGRRVVRLKSGDPFIFGRSLSEIEALNQAGCPFEVVPGVSSALAAPLLAGIPLTDPVMSRCFAVLTAHDLEAIDWQALSQLETLVILMGAKQLVAIVERLQQRGKPAETPIAVIRWAGQPQQQVWTGTLASIGRQTAQQSLSPAVIVIGAVVGLRPYLRSAVSSVEGLAENDLQTNLRAEMQNAPSNLPGVNAALPLAGRTILVTRSAGQSSRFTALLQQQGATVVETPALEIVPPSSWAGLDEAIAQLQQFDWLILTSTNGVDYFFDRLMQLGKDARALAQLKVAVVGQKTAASLQQRGLQPDFIPPNFVADALVEHFPDRDRLSGMRLLFPRVETGGREVLVQELSAQGAIVTEVAAYQSVCAQAIDPAALRALAANQVDILTFASSKTVQCFHRLCQASPPFAIPLLASIGPQTSADCWRCFGRVDIEASEYTLEGLTQAIVDWVHRSG